jgi:DNA-binding PadR family transcriptional regulator
MAKKTMKAMPKCATETKQGVKISKDEVTIVVKGKKTPVKVYAITVGGVKKYAKRRALAPVDNAKYMTLEQFEADRNTVKPRKAKKGGKAAKATQYLSDAAMALIPTVAKLGKAEIKHLAVEALKYKRVNAMAVKAQIKADKLKAKAAAIQAQIEALEAGK